MRNPGKLIIESLGSHHNRQNFSCGVDSLDSYLKKQAKQDVKRRIARVFVATSDENPNAILGFYTLSTLAIELTQLPNELARKLPKHPIPAALIGRLACSTLVRGQGIGKMLLMDAIKRTLVVSEDIAIYAMVVDAIDEQAQRFYEQYGFSRLAVDSGRLFLPLKSFSPGNGGFK